MDTKKPDPKKAPEKPAKQAAPKPAPGKAPAQPSKGNPTPKR